MRAVCEIIKRINLIFYESQDTTCSSLTAPTVSAGRPLRLLCSLVKSCSFWRAALFWTPSLPSDISANVKKLQFMRCNGHAAQWYTTYTYLLQANSFSKKSMTAGKETWKNTLMNTNGLWINYTQNNIYSIIYIAHYTHLSIIHNIYLLKVVEKLESMTNDFRLGAWYILSRSPITNQG